MAAACADDRRDTASAQGLEHRRTWPVAEVDVEHGGIKGSLLPNELSSLADGCSRPDRNALSFDEKHAEGLSQERLVLDEQHTAACQLVVGPLRDRRALHRSGLV
jgi:hypothetical protein